MVGKIKEVATWHHYDWVYGKILPHIDMHFYSEGYIPDYKMIYDNCKLDLTNTNHNLEQKENYDRGFYKMYL